MFIVEITRKENKQFFGVSDGIEFKIDTNKLTQKIKKGDVIEGKLMGDTIIAEIVKEAY